eukprot:gene24778-biopygen20917
MEIPGIPSTHLHCPGKLRLAGVWRLQYGPPVHVCVISERKNMCHIEEGPCPWVWVKGSPPWLKGSLPWLKESLPWLKGSLPWLKGSLPWLKGSLPWLKVSPPARPSKGIPPWHASLASSSRVRAAIRTAPGARKVRPDDTDGLRDVRLAVTRFPVVPSALSESDLRIDMNIRTTCVDLVWITVVGPLRPDPPPNDEIGWTPPIPAPQNLTPVLKPVGGARDQWARHGTSGRGTGPVGEARDQWAGHGTSHRIPGITGSVISPAVPSHCPWRAAAHGGPLPMAGRCPWRAAAHGGPGVVQHRFGNIGSRSVQRGARPSPARHMDGGWSALAKPGTRELQRNCGRSGGRAHASRLQGHGADRQPPRGVRPHRPHPRPRRRGEEVAL